MVKRFHGINGYDSYVIGKIGLGCVLVDASMSAKDIEAYLRQYSRPLAILLTDVKKENLYSLPALLKKYRDIPIYYHKAGLDDLLDALPERMNLKPIEKDSEITLHNSFGFKALVTPLGSASSLSYLFLEDNAIFVGNILAEKPVKDDSYELSLDKIRDLSPYLSIYKDNGISSLSQEKEANPLLNRALAEKLFREEAKTK